MTSPHLDPVCLQFLDKHLDSMEKLEIMRHVREARRAVPRSELKAVVPSGDDMLRTVIRELVHGGLLDDSPEDQSALHLGPRALDPAFETIMAIYELDRVAVLTALSSIAMRRIRNLAARTFADAFVLKKRRKDDDG